MPDWSCQSCLLFRCSPEDAVAASLGGRRARGVAQPRQRGRGLGGGRAAVAATAAASGEDAELAEGRRGRQQRATALLVGGGAGEEEATIITRRGQSQTCWLTCLNALPYGLRLTPLALTKYRSVQND